MRKLKLQVQMTMDGFIAGPNSEMDWMTFPWTEDISEYVTKLTEPVDTILLGRNLAEGFIPHWTGVANDPNNPEQEAGKKYYETHKVVFSKTLKQSEWENTEVENGDFVQKIEQLKNQPGGDIIVYGGATFVSSLIKEKLIDELHLFINPAIVGHGLPIFRDISEKQRFTLVAASPFKCGIVALAYKKI
ncbi:dihydrofolate reductase [Larkinella knui]|uniref:Dihydrofolate reductase n=2 Tax=Larkinella knui TaxID=2025310 RepID=A0A3P1CJ86_9BACT|nr:dihydrofolate reductase [Larkinella knui]